MTVLFRLVLAAVAFVIFAGGPAPAEAGSTSGVEMTVGAGWGFTDQSDINDKYIDELAKPAGLLDDNLSHRISFYGELGYVLPPRHVLCVGLSYMGGKSAKESSSPIVDENQNIIGSMTVSNELTTSAVILHVRVKYFLWRKSRRPFVGLGLAYAFGEAESTHETVVDSSGATLWRSNDDYTGRGWGWFVTLGTKRDLTGPLAVGVEGGYRRLLTADLKDEAGEVWRFDGSSPAQAIRLDFSGWFVMGTLSVEL